MLQIKQLNKSFSNKQIFKNFNYTLETHGRLLISGVRRVESLLWLKLLQD